MSDGKTIFYGVLASVIATLLLTAGTFLTNFVPNPTALYYRAAVSKVGNLSAWTIDFVNASDRAIDQFEIRLPNEDGLLRWAFEPAVDTRTASDGWKGALIAGSSLKALFIFDRDTPFVLSKIESLVVARYRVLDKRTGQLSSEDATVQFGSPPTISRSLQIVVAFLIPFLATGLLIGAFFLIKFLLSLRRA